MDPHAFDRLARAFAAGGTRRRLVGLLAALPVAGLLAARAEEAAAAAYGKLGGEPCRENSECQTHLCRGNSAHRECTCSNIVSIPCANPALRCAEERFPYGECIRPAPGGAHCADGVECQSNQCLDGRCSCADGSNAIPCKDPAQICLNGRCVARKRGGEACNADRECQTNTCDTGVCSCANGDRPVPCVELANPCVKQVCVAQECRRQKREDGTACPPADNPCVDDMCQNGQCVHRTKPDGAKCGDGGSCQNGTCRCDAATEQICPGKHGKCKLPLGQTCTRDAQCCPEHTCCRGKCRLKSGEGECRTDDDCCSACSLASPHTCLGPR